MIIRNVTINLGYKCNNHCKCCYDDGRRLLPNKSIKRVFNNIINAISYKTKWLELIGGETTIRNDIADIVKFARDFGFKHIFIVTNGRMFAYDIFARKMIKTGITQIIFSIYGHNAKLHDSVTNTKGSFKELITGIQNLKNTGFNSISFNTVILKQNYKYLPDILKLVNDYGIKEGELIFVDSNSWLRSDSFYKFTPKLSQISPYVYNCLDMFKDPVYKLHIRGVPFCRMVGYEDKFSDLCEEDDIQKINILSVYNNRNNYFYRMTGRIKVPKCKTCGYFGLCAGINLKYYHHYGDDELIPVRQRPKETDIKKMVFRFYKFYP